MTGLEINGGAGRSAPEICLPPQEVPGVGATPALMKIEDHVFILCSLRTKIPAKEASQTVVLATKS